MKDAKRRFDAIVRGPPICFDPFDDNSSAGEFEEEIVHLLTFLVETRNRSYRHARNALTEAIARLQP